MAKKKSSSKKKEKQQKVSPISAWRVLAGIFCFAAATIGCAYSYKPAGKLSLGIGDMIFAQNAKLERIQCGYIGPDYFRQK